MHYFISQSYIKSIKCSILKGLTIIILCNVGKQWKAKQLYLMKYVFI